MNNLSILTKHLKQKGYSQKEIDSVFDEMHLEGFIENPFTENIIETLKLKHFDDFLEDELGKYGLNHGYEFNKSGSYSKHIIFLKGTEKIETNCLIEWVFKKDIVNSPLEKILKINPRLEQNNIKINKKKVIVNWMYVKDIAKFSVVHFNHHDIYIKKCIQNQTKIEIKKECKKYKQIIKKIKKSIKNYCKLIKKGYEILSRKKRPIIYSISKR